MRIGIDARGINKELDGIGRFGLNLIRDLSKIDTSNEYIIYKNPSIDHLLIKRENFTEKTLNIARYTVEEQLMLPKILVKDNLDVFHSLHNILPISYPGASIITIHDIMAIVFRWFYEAFPLIKKHIALSYFRLFVKLSAVKAKKIIVPSKHTQKDLIQYLNLNKKKIKICPEAVDDIFIVTDSNAKQKLLLKYQFDSPYFLYAGNFKPYKNLKNLILAYDILDKKKLTLPKLVIAGRDKKYEKPLKSFINRLGLNGKIIFTGYVASNDLPVLMNGALFFIFPSIYEGFGLPILEAMACGTPVITSNVTSLPEVAGDAALLVNPYDPKAIADGIQLLLTDNKLRTGLITKGFDRVKLFSWEKCAKETLKVYEEVYNGE